MSRMHGSLTIMLTSAAGPVTSAMPAHRKRRNYTNNLFAMQAATIKLCMSPVPMR